MNKKGISAVVGVIIMVAIVIGIAAAVYIYVNNEMEKREAAKEIDMFIMDYSVNDDGALQMKLGFINDNNEINAKITIEVEELTVMNRVETETYFKFAKVINTTIEPGNTTKTIAEPWKLLDTKTYRVDVSMKTDYCDYPRESFYIFAE